MVYDSYLNRGVTEYYTKQGYENKGSGEGLTKLVLPTEAGNVYRTLYQLYYNYGKRVDQRLAKQVAYSLLEGYLIPTCRCPTSLMCIHTRHRTRHFALALQRERGGLTQSCRAGWRALTGVPGTLFYKLLFETGKTEEEVSCVVGLGLDQRCLTR